MDYSSATILAMAPIMDVGPSVSILASLNNFSRRVCALLAATKEKFQSKQKEIQTPPLPASQER